MPKVKMVESMPNRWKIETEAGAVLQKDILVAGNHNASVYVKNYVSSFPNWDYELVPMPRQEKK